MKNMIRRVVDEMTRRALIRNFEVRCISEIDSIPVEYCKTKDLKVSLDKIISKEEKSYETTPYDEMADEVAETDKVAENIYDKTRPHWISLAEFIKLHMN